MKITPAVRNGIIAFVAVDLGIFAWLATQPDFLAQVSGGAEHTATSPAAASPAAPTAPKTPTAPAAPDAAKPSAVRASTAQLPPAPYTIVEDKAVGPSNGPRYCARITVPGDLSREVLTATVEHALRATYEGHAKGADKPAAVCVFSFRADDDLQGAFTAAKGDYAPGGRWEDADAAVPLASWRTVVTLSEEYFAPAPAAMRFGTSTKVSLAALGADKKPLPDGKVNVLAGYPDREPVAASVPTGTVAEVVEGRTYFVSKTMSFAFYRVRLKVKGELVEGWVPERACQQLRPATKKARLELMKPTQQTPWMRQQALDREAGK